MEYQFINLELEKQIRQEIGELLEEDIVMKVIKQGKIGKEYNIYRAIYEGHSFKVTKALLPALYDLCEEVKEILDFKEPIDFFVTNSPDINAHSLAKIDDEESHLIIFNSGLIERFDDDELKFVIGHEIGHFISTKAEFKRIINFIFPDLKKMPIIFQNKLMLWERLSEITSDRYGFIASPKFEKCITNFFKLSSGLGQKNLIMNPKAYMKMIDDTINNFMEEPMAVPTTHPVHPVRIKALQYFSESQLFKDIQANKPLKEDEELQKKILELVPLLIAIKDSELDVHRAYFIASAGLLVAMADEKIVEEEIDEIISTLAHLEVFPRVFLEKIIDDKNIGEVLVKSASRILSVNPSERIPMFQYMIHVALRDRKIEPAEIKFLYDTGEKIFRFEEKEIAQMIGQAIQESFLPRFYK